MENKIEFSIPGLYGFNHLNMFLFELIEKYPNKFYDDFKITSMYGSFPECIWNGGRGVGGTFIAKDVQKAVEILNKRGVTLRYTFTNCKLSKEDTYDHVCNQVLKLTKKYQTIKNDINVGSEVLKNYIEEKYKDDFNIVMSTTLCVKDVDEINKITEKYLLVPDYSINNDFEKLSRLKYKENIEILANESCNPNCPARRRHYEELSSYFLKEEVEPIDCYYANDPNHENYYRANVKQCHHIKREDILNKYLPLGVNKFKIVGRGVTILKVIEGYVEYFVKQEYRDEIRYDLLNFIMSN